MRKYYNDFNEEYERGYEAGRRAAMRNLDESYDLDKFEKFANRLNLAFVRNSDGTASLQTGFFNYTIDPEAKGSIKVLAKLDISPQISGFARRGKLSTSLIESILRDENRVLAEVSKFED